MFEEKKKKQYQAHAQTSISLQKKITQTQYDTQNYQKILSNCTVLYFLATWMKRYSYVAHLATQIPII